MQVGFGNKLEVPKTIFGAQKQKIERKRSSSIAKIETLKMSVYDQISAFCGQQSHGGYGTEKRTSSLSAGNSCNSLTSNLDEGYDSRRSSMDTREYSCSDQGMQPNKLSLIPISKKNSFTVEFLEVEKKPRSVSVAPHVKIQLEMTFEDPITGEWLTPEEYISIAVDDELRLNSFPNEWSLDIA
ncbi:uncharacterized protein LOC134844706 isoform X2 [Symsagittifera roscoffensis]|uniref:uncharacterized protein LOC134844706 isoform X2 n=1 Tax=Symsagittifera roscoffensis TaxID=84072 RepID=UPI00307BF3DB